MEFMHYYGDIIRRLFLAAGVVMLVSLPFMQTFIPFPIFVSLLAILVIGFAAGLIAPAQIWVITLNVVVAAIAMVTFEYYAAMSYLENNYRFFFANQLLAVIFFAAFYYAVKTIRGSFSKPLRSGDNKPGDNKKGPA